jgi:hypothetical protein
VITKSHPSFVGVATPITNQDPSIEMFPFQVLDSFVHRGRSCPAVKALVRIGVRIELNFPRNIKSPLRIHRTQHFFKAIQMNVFAFVNVFLQTLIADERFPTNVATKVLVLQVNGVHVTPQIGDEIGTEVAVVAPQ